MPARILLVEDDADLHISLALRLKSAGYEVLSAMDGSDVVPTALRHRPDLILLDIGLPRIDGYEACRRIRAQAWAKDVVIVALTGWGQDEDRRQSQEAGFDHHMVKPVDYATLLKLLAAVFAIHRKLARDFHAEWVESLRIKRKRPLGEVAVTEQQHGP